MNDIHINVSQEIFDNLKNLIPEPTDDIVANLALAALQEWMDWLSGDSRPMSISELEIERIYKIYEKVLTKQFPSVDRLGKIFQMPMGRARYIIQSLAYRRGRFLFKRQLIEISEALGQLKEPPYVIVIDRGCQSIIDRSFNDLLAKKQIVSTVSGVMTVDGVRYEMGKNHCEALSNEIKRQLGTLSKTS
jgi:hypothetical protein